MPALPPPPSPEVAQHLVLTRNAVPIAVARVFLNISDSSARKLIKNGTLPAFSTGQKWLIPTVALKRMVGLDDDAA